MNWHLPETALVTALLCSGDDRRRFVWCKFIIKGCSGWKMTSKVVNLSRRLYHHRNGSCEILIIFPVSIWKPKIFHSYRFNSQKVSDRDRKQESKVIKHGDSWVRTADLCSVSLNKLPGRRIRRYLNISPLSSIVIWAPCREITDRWQIDRW